jgi:cytochrome oxidase Cu insertion factor (SCO1/SenC/PrrC family)
VVELGAASHGTLMSPPVQISELALSDASGEPLDYSQPEPRWSYLVLGGAKCDGLCERTLYVTGQTHKLLGKKYNRVQRFYVSTEAELNPELQQLIEEQHEKLRVAYGDSDVISKALGGQGLDPLSDQVFFMVDPRGWVMMYYTLSGTSQQALGDLSKDMIKDVKRLMP